MMVRVVEEAAVPRALEGLGPRTRQLGGCGGLRKRTTNHAKIPFRSPRGPWPSQQEDSVVKARPLGGGYCHERPVWRLPQRLHFLFWTVYFPCRPHCPPLHCNLSFVR